MYTMYTMGYVYTMYTMGYVYTMAPPYNMSLTCAHTRCRNVPASQPHTTQMVTRGAVTYA